MLPPTCRFNRMFIVSWKPVPTHEASVEVTVNAVTPSMSQDIEVGVQVKPYTCQFEMSLSLGTLNKWLFLTLPSLVFGNTVCTVICGRPPIASRMSISPCEWSERSQNAGHNPFAVGSLARISHRPYCRDIRPIVSR